MLQFLGRGSAFRSEHNCAFFTCGNELVLLDCPMSAFHKLRHIGAEKLAGGDVNITVLVTHTHGDHTGGIATLIHYEYYIKHRTVTVIAPSEEVAEDLDTLFTRIEGCAPEGFRLITATQAAREWLLDVIPTHHSPELEGRCFGYRLLVDGEKAVYTGDTAVIEPFLPYLGSDTALYSDCSAYNPVVHLNITELLEKVKGRDIKLYLMHLDDTKKILDAAQGSGALLAPLYES